MKVFYSVLFSLILTLSVFVGSGNVYAQNYQDSINENPGTGVNQETNPGTGTVADDNNEGGFNPWWLLPLLAIPLFFIFKDDKKEDRSYRDQGQFLGAKGGRSERSREEDKN